MSIYLHKVELIHVWVDSIILYKLRYYCLHLTYVNSTPVRSKCKINYQDKYFSGLLRTNESEFERSWVCQSSQQSSQIKIGTKTTSFCVNKINLKSRKFIQIRLV